jgi:catechol 2,3-dioxygenase-like lactoylglutathione lyase family enzyme
MTSTIDRRGFLVSLPALMMAPRAIAQTDNAPIKLRSFNHVNLTVSDLKHSVDFYQGLFGMPVQGRTGSTGVQLRIGSGPQHLALSSGDSGATPKIDHYCLSVDAFNVDRIVKTLAAHGVTRSDERGAMKVLVSMRADTPQVYIGDPDGIALQLQDVSYCGGTGSLGAVCAPAELSPKKGLISLKGYSHCTVFAADASRSNAFYQQLFGMSIRSYQGPTAPTLAVGPGVEFLMFAGGGAGRGGATAAPPRPAGINHFCFNLEGFNPDQILKTLESYGIKPRENQNGPVGSMRSYVSLRMENRGGAKEGTPELYFTDPDGILVQLQDVSYCGGSGFLGNVCPAT